MPGNTHLAWRAVLAIALMLSFYGLALTVAGALLVIPFLLWSVAKSLLLKVGLFCLIGAFAILKAILPRPDHFEPPGPQLTLEKQPALFAEIRDLALRTGQDPPAEVYLIPDVNAWVGQRGGFMGLGSRRVMGIGLPLLQTLTLPELRGVLAHEFGHFHGGDVAIGPWIYKTRAALVRTVTELASHSKALSQVFLWYGNLFFRITHAVRATRSSWPIAWRRTSSARTPSRAVSAARTRRASRSCPTGRARSRRFCPPASLHRWPRASTPS